MGRIQGREADIQEGFECQETFIYPPTIIDRVSSLGRAMCWWETGKEMVNNSCMSPSLLRLHNQGSERIEFFLLLKLTSQALISPQFPSVLWELTLQMSISSKEIFKHPPLWHSFPSLASRRQSWKINLTFT